MDRIYMDNAATTAICPEALAAMLPCFAEHFGNASSIHGTGRDARKTLEEARRKVADILGAKPAEIYFTSGGSESDNWAIKGAAFANRNKGNHIITTQIEHHAVLHTCQWLEKQGFEVTYLPVDEYGLVNPADVEAAITGQTILISVMAANNEIGTIEPIAEIGQIAHAHKILFHCDAVQAVGAIPVNVDSWHVDMLSLSGHKFHGPKGVGALYIRTGSKVDQFMHGGAQERGRRATTENVPGIVGMAAALEKAAANLEENGMKLIYLRDKLIQGILEKIPYARLNGHPLRRLPGNVNVSIPFVEGEALLLRLDLAGVAGSSGSACTSGSLDPSHVLLAIGLPHEIAHGSLRLSLTDTNTEEEVDEVLRLLPQIVETLRAMSPMYDDFIQSSENGAQSTDEYSCKNCFRTEQTK